MSIKTIGVIGAGTMGHGIAQVAAQAGYDVLLYDSSADALKAAQGKIRASAEILSKKGLITERQWLKVRGRIDFVSELPSDRDADLIIEAIVEDEAQKKRLFKKLDALCKPECIFATNTSSISITELAKAVRGERKKRFIGMHFMNPPQLVPLLELIRGKDTSDDAVAAVREVAARMGRDPIVESKDTAGFIVNRVLISAINEAAGLVGNGIGTAEDVDKSIIIGVGSSRGMPILRLADLIGIDICVNVLRVMAREHGDCYAPSSTLETMVKEGRLGRKTGRGFFSYA